ncbi:MAG: 50S ribosomal protein L29 [Acidobacteriota bacterium]|nr:MAG: 50S ribosomal protein L29 [Acidobacteriota bacterium]
MKRKEQLDQLKEMNADELKEQADALKESLFRLKFRKALGVGEVVNDIRREKKTLARVYTLLNDKKAEASATSGATETAEAEA